MSRSRGGELSGRVEPVLDPKWDRSALRWVAFIQTRKTREILGATIWSRSAQTPVGRPGAP